MFWLSTAALGVPSVPPPVGANATSLATALATAAAAHHPTFTIPPGRYVFSNSSLVLSGASDLQIVAKNVTFVFYYGFGMDCENCRNVQVSGLTFDSDPPNYAQGSFTSLSSDGRSFVGRFDDRFIPPDTTKQPFAAPGGSAGAKVVFWNATTRRLDAMNVHFLLNTRDSKARPARNES